MALALSSGAAVLLAGCGGAPQIVDYAPDRGATGVVTNVRVRIDFDRPVDRQSVASRFSLRPAAKGRLAWPSATEMLFTPQGPLRTDTAYRVQLRAGYRSLGGGAADLDHAWTFRTEGPPEATGWTPAAGDRGVDPASYLLVSFNHRLNPAGLTGAFAIQPALPLSASVDPTDPFRAVVAPEGLLAANTTYRLTATRAVHDADGNPLAGDASVSFTTGPTRPLHGWLTCIASPLTGSGSSPSLWALDADHFGRRLLPGPVLDYNWAPTADEIAVETAPRSWQDQVLGHPAATLPLPADDVLPLGSGRGIVYLAGGDLGLLTPGGQQISLVQDVESVALSADGTQLAYTVPAADGTEVWGMTVELRSRYLLDREPGAISGLAWAPDGSRLAYTVVTDTATEIRVRVLAAPAATTMVTGQVDAFAWDADSQHLYLLLTRGTQGLRRVFRVAFTGAQQSLPVGGGLPAGTLQLDQGPALPSPDGHQVAFAAAQGTGPLEVWLMNADGTGLERLTGAPGYSYSCREPRWTPPA